jgi:hypothetical protein
MSKKKTKRGSRPIVVGHLEKVGRGVFSRFQRQITECVKGSFGVYALYRNNKLYYIGLASNLKSRIRGHLKDKHGKSWTHFSLYVFRRESHIRELESLLLRIAYPEGNLQRGKLKSSLNLTPKLKGLIKRQYENDIKNWFDELKEAGKKTKNKKKKMKVKGEQRPLKGLLRDWQRIYSRYKGKDYKAKVLPSGSIKLNGKIYNTPTGAALTIVDRRTVNGWNFWKFKNEKGKLVKLKELRK